MSLTKEQKKKIAQYKLDPTYEWRGLFDIVDEFMIKYPQVDEDYLIGILNECVDGGIWIARDRQGGENE